MVRHGVTTLSVEDRFAGSTEVPLSEAGEEQARRLGARLATVPIAAVYASPMRRALRTAELIVAPKGLAITPVDGLREIAHGRWEQLTRHEVEAQYPEEYSAWEEDPFTFAPVGGESGLAVLARALPALRQIVAEHADQTVLVVSHKATLRLMIGSLLGFDPRGYRDRLDQHPCCLNVLDFKGPTRARLMLFNDTSHYESQPSALSTSLSKWWDEAPPTKG